MDNHDFDEDLNTIKAFHTFLTEIINKGYTNDIDIIKKIVKHINNYIDDDTEKNTESDNSDDENENNELKNKIQQKIDKFMESNNDLSKIYLYKKYNYINNMNEFINSTYGY